MPRLRDQLKKMIREKAAEALEQGALRLRGKQNRNRISIYQMLKDNGNDAIVAEMGDTPWEEGSADQIIPLCADDKWQDAKEWVGWQWMGGGTGAVHEGQNPWHHLFTRLSFYEEDHEPSGPIPEVIKAQLRGRRARLGIKVLYRGQWWLAVPQGWEFGKLIYIDFELDYLDLIPWDAIDWEDFFDRP